jgi:hypothetical protein
MKPSSETLKPTNTSTISTDLLNRPGHRTENPAIKSIQQEAGVDGEIPIA